MINLTDDIKIIKQIAETLAFNVPDIDLVILYGSFARGLGHELSDYDIIIICDTKKVAWNFVLNERPVQAWSMTWEFAEKLLKGEAGCWSIGAASLINGIIVWKKNEKCSERFRNLLLQASEGARRTVKKAINEFDTFYSKLWQINKLIRKNKTKNVRLLIWDLANDICEVLSGLNNHPYHNLWGKQLIEIEKFDVKPENYIERYKELVTAEPVKALKIAEKLTDDIYELLVDWLQKNEPKPIETFKDITTEWSSAIESLNSIKSAMKMDKKIAGIYAVTDFTEFIFWLYMIFLEIKWDRNSFYPIDEYLKNFPQNIRKNVEVLLFSTQLEDLVNAAENITQDLKQQYIKRGIELPVVKSLDEGLKFLRI